jgi:ribosomal protein S18 acetylase RimI-like enzyme
MSVPQLPGLTIRAATRADVAAITALIAAGEIADNGVAEVQLADVEHAFDLADEPAGVIVVEARDQMIGWATVADDQADVEVHPAWRGRGIGAALLAWTEARARASGSPRVRQIVTDSDAAARSLFEAAGYRVRHTSWVLQQRLDEAPPDVELPPGVKIRDYRAADAESAYRVIEDAFNEWPDRQPREFAAWSAQVIGHPAFAPELSRLALEGDRLVGVVLCMDYDGAEEGWVDQIATVATHRHRGIGRALLQSVFAAYHAQGRRLVGLSTNSQSGALTLYERIGMRVRRSYTAWVKDLA